MKLLRSILLIVAISSGFISYAGNDRKRGVAGAAELLINPWGRSAGWNNLNVGGIGGVESFNLNVAGLTRINNMELEFSSLSYMQGSDVSINSFGLAKSLGDNGNILGVSISAISWGDLLETTTDQPEGTGNTITPQFFNMSAGYGKKFSERISVGIAIRLVYQSLPNITAAGLTADAGIQYQAGLKNRFKFGVSLRNYGFSLTYRGDGLEYDAVLPNANYSSSVFVSSEEFAIPAMMNIGTSYDFFFGEEHTVTPAFGFVSNTFTADEFKLGAQYAFKEYFSFRMGFTLYKSLIDIGADDSDSFIEFSEGLDKNSTRSAPSFGFTLQYPFGELNNKRLAFDYAYQLTNPYNGNHTISLRFGF